MENASQALIMAFSIIIFVIALTISVSMFSMARATSDFVIFKSDKTNYYTYNIVDENTEKNTRVVGMETIVPTLYRYYKENYRVEFYDKNENPLGIYEIDGVSINYFDVDDEIKEGRTWIGSQESFKEHVDKLVKNELIPKYAESEFEEKYVTKIISANNGTDSETDVSTEDEKKEKIIIKYKKIN